MVRADAEVVHAAGAAEADLAVGADVVVTNPVVRVVAVPGGSGFRSCGVGRGGGGAAGAMGAGGVVVVPELVELPLQLGDGECAGPDAQLALEGRVCEEMGKNLRPVYTAPTEAAAAERFREFDAKWGGRYPAISKLWQNAWSEFVPILDWDVEIRRIICSTNAIESLNARYRRAVRPRGHFPNDAAALKCLYLVTRSLDPTGRGRARCATRWKPALNAFAIAFEGRIN